MVLVDTNLIIYATRPDHAVVADWIEGLRLINPARVGG